MTTSQKAAISLLITVLIFGVFSVLAFTGLFDALEARFYYPSVNALSTTAMKVILLAAFFLTTYLIVFLLLNLKQDPLTVVQNRLKQLQVSLIEQFYERKGEADWARWIRELENRREEVRALLKRGVTADSNAKSVAPSNKSADGKITDIDILINKSWDELLAMLGSRRNLEIDEEKIAQILQNLLEARISATPKTSAAADNKTDLLNKVSSVASAIEKKGTESAEEIEVLEELDEADPIVSTDLSDDTAAADESNTPPLVSPTNIDDLASQIEFSPDIQPGTTDDELFNEELEIVSPFSAMVFDFSATDDAVADVAGAAEEDPSIENHNKNEDTGLDTDATEGLPLITTPFSGFPGGAWIEPLEISNDAKEKQTNGDDSIISEREGVHYISDDVLAPSPEFSAILNPGFKELVDEVTK